MAGRLTDSSFLKLKDEFNKDYHGRWAGPLCEEKIVYACKDAYACYAIWNRVNFMLQGLHAAGNRRTQKSLKNKWEPTHGPDFVGRYIYVLVLQDMVVASYPSAYYSVRLT